MRITPGPRRPQRSRSAPESKPHPWQRRDAGTPRLFVDKRLAARLEQEAAGAAAHGRETMSLLLGDVFRDAGDRDPFAVALESASAPLLASGTHVEFDPAHMDSLAKALDNAPFDYLLVGWFHTHVGIGARPSETDERTQARYFTLAHQYAVIFDAEVQDAAAFRFADGRLRQAPFAVFDASLDRGNPWGAPRA